MIILWCNRIFFHNPYFHFMKPEGCMVDHLGNTVLDSLLTGVSIRPFAFF